MSEKRGVFTPEEIQIGRHYWFQYIYKEIATDCVIKVLHLSGHVVEGRVVDTETLVFFFSKFELENMDEIEEELQDLEVLAEQLIREVSEDELKSLRERVEESTKDFFSVEPPRERRLLN